MLKKFSDFVYRYFFPHEGNNHKAASLHPGSLMFYLIVLIAIQMSAGIVKHANPGVLGYATDINVNQVLYYVNLKRTQNGLAPLKLDPQLSVAATQKGTDMFTKNYWAHISPTGVTPWNFINSSGYKYIYAGENLAKDFDTSSEVVDAWMNSPTHRANLLKPQYEDIGLAVLNGKLNGEDTTLVVEEFGSKDNSASLASLPDNTQTALPTPTVLPVGEARIVTPPPVTPLQAAPVYQKDTNPAVNKSILTLPFTISRTFSVALAELLLGVLAIDGFYMWKRKIVRVSGHSISHFIFLLALLGAMGATGIGVIL